MRELALFAGAGGGILGGKLLGWRTVCACELNPYCRAVLLARQRDGLFDPFPIWDDIRTFDGLPWRGAVDVVSGGFPCQDISALGKGAGIDGPKSGLWREMARIIGEVRPRFAFVENSPMLVQRGLARVLGDLAELRFDARWGIMGADEVGAPHICKRIWLVAFAAAAPDGGHEDVGDADRIGCQQSLQTQHPVLRRMKAGHPVMRLSEHLCRLSGTVIIPNPAFWEWMMGWPIGSTGLKPLATAKFQAWLRAHGTC